MSVFEAVVLGLVQGLTEFLPVSSSGHLTLVERAMGIDMEGLLALDVALHGATLASILAYFGRAWARRLLAEPRLAAFAVAAGVPAAAVHFAGGERVVAAAKLSLWAVGALFMGAGAFLVFASVFASVFTSVHASRRREVGTGEAGEAGEAAMLPRGRGAVPVVVGAGLAQAAALFPGVSRSGSTMGAGLLCGLTREGAFEFSFLAGAPLLAGALVVKSVGIGEIASASGGALAAGAVVAFASGIGALALLRRVVARGRLWVFGAYTMVIGTGCFVWATASHS